MSMPVFAAVTALAALLYPLINGESNNDPTLFNSRDADRSRYIIVGDGEFNQVMPEYPADPATEHLRHALRLEYIENLLRSRDVGAMPADLRAERMKNLDRLRAYRQRGEFPVNYEHPNAWEPVFIDRHGAICAVGYLVEQSVGRETAEKIAERYRYATVKQIDAPELAQWIATSGLTKAEVVTIQGPALESDGAGRGRNGLRMISSLINGNGPAISSDSVAVSPIRRALLGEEIQMFAVQANGIVVAPAGVDGVGLSLPEAVSPTDSSATTDAPAVPATPTIH